jgi:hypothetical protein
MNYLDIAQNENESFSLFVGESGSGKTAAIASYGKLGPLLLLDFDKRVKGIDGLRTVLGTECLKNIEVKQYNIHNSFKEVDEELSKLVDQSKMGKCPYKTIVLESVNTLEVCFMNMVDMIAEQRKGTGIATSTVGGIRVYGPAHYKFAASAFRQLRDFRLLQLKGVHVILSCWTVNKWDKPTTVNDKGVEIKLQYADNIVVGKKLHLTDKMSEEVPGCFDDIFEFYKQEDSRKPEKVKHGVRFVSSIAKSTNEKLKAIGDLDLTDKCFIDEIKKAQSKTAASSNG